MSSIRRCLSKFEGPFVLTLAIAAGVPCRGQMPPSCSQLPDAGRLRGVLQSVVRGGPAKNGGMGNQEWAAAVNRDGVVCAIVFSGTTRSDEWPGSAPPNPQAVFGDPASFSTPGVYCCGTVYAVLIRS